MVRTRGRKRGSMNNQNSATDILDSSNSGATHLITMSSNMDSIINIAIDKFTGSKYDNWKFRIHKILKSKDLLKVTEEGVIADNRASERSDACAQAIIISYIGDEVLELIKDAASAK